MSFKMDESLIEHQAEKYFDRYRDQFDAFEKHSTVARALDRVNENHFYSLGCQLEKFEEYQAFCENSNTIGSLGTIPSIALDVITASYGNSILPLIASTQPIEEERGVIYFKRTKATKTEGGRTAGDIINDSRNMDSYSDSYGAATSTETLGTGNGTDTNFTGTLTNIPTRPNTFRFENSDGTKGIDDGEGNLYGNGFSGTINYETGAFDITFLAAVANSVTINLTYAQDQEARDDLPGIAGTLASDEMNAEVFALKAESGLLHEYAFQKRFGRMASDEIAMDLSEELTKTLNTAAIKRLAAVAGTPINWSLTPPDPSISYAEHKLSFVDTVSDSDRELNTGAGRGNINRMIAGSVASAKLRGMPGFVAAEGSSNSAVGLFGYYNDIPVIRASTIIPDNKIVNVFKGTGHFDTALVHSPYMPLFVSDTIASGRNPLRNQRVAAVWCGLKPVIKSFVTSIDIVA